MEKRRFPRLAKCLPLECSWRLPDSGEICSGKGFSQDISLGSSILNARILSLIAAR